MRSFVSLSILLLLSLMVSAQEENRIVGVWVTQDGDSRITIERDAAGRFHGRISWLKEPLNEQGKPKVDDENPDRSLRSRPILGLRLLENFTYNRSERRWDNGTIYDPQDGKTYRCLLWFENDPNRLHVRGFIGISLIGREVVWTRYR